MVTDDKNEWQTTERAPQQPTQNKSNQKVNNKIMKRRRRRKKKEEKRKKKEIRIRKGMRTKFEPKNLRRKKLH